MKRTLSVDRRTFLQGLGAATAAASGCLGNGVRGQRGESNAAESQSAGPIQTIGLVSANDYNDVSSLQHLSGYRSNAENVSLSESHAYQGKSLRIDIQEGNHFGASMSYPFPQNRARQPTEVWATWYLYFPESFELDSNGLKLPGPAGTYNQAGWGGRQSDGTNGWSARMMFFERTDHPYLAYYVYHADMDYEYGDLFDWDGGPTIRFGQWYRLDQYVKMNTPGVHDGVLRGWIDGSLAFEKTDLMFRTVPDLKVQEYWFDFYWGGADPSPADNRLFVDNLSILRRSP